MRKAEIRRARADNMARTMLSFIHFPINGVVQVGLGDWAEGPALLNFYRKASFYAFEPIERYRREAKEAGFPGVTDDRVVGDVSGETRTFGDRRSRTSVFSGATAPGLGKITASTVTLNDALCDKWSEDSTLLWLDCEGSEKLVLQGANLFLPQVSAVIMELKDSTPFEWWTPTAELVKIMNQLGFDMVFRIPGTKGDGDGVFLKRSLV